MFIHTRSLSIQLLGIVVIAGCSSSSPGLPGSIVDAPLTSDTALPDASPPDDVPAPPPPDAPVDAEIDAPAAPPPDAPADAEIDAPGPDPVRDLERLDWRTTRGAPFTTTAVDLPSAELFALSSASFVARTSCQDSQQGCTYTWHDAAGTAGLRRERMANVTGTLVSPDGRRAALVALDEPMRGCEDNGVVQLVARGTLQLIDLATGATSLDLALRSNLWNATGFTPDGSWMFASPLGDTACLPPVTGLRSIATPFAPPAGLDGTAELLQEVTARRWIARRDRDVGVVDPLTPGSFSSFGVSPKRFEATGGWAHVYFGFGELVQELFSQPPTGPATHVTLRDEDWFPFGSWGRWVRVCQFLHLEGFRDCRVVDVLGQAPAVELVIAMSRERPDDAVLLDGAIVFVGPTSEGFVAVQRIDLLTGRRELLHVGDGALRPIGNGAGALLLQKTTAWLIEAQREELVASDVTHVFTSLQLLPGRVPSRQDDLAVIVSSSSSRRTLRVLDVQTRRLATLTDDLHFTPLPFPVPFVATDSCGMPWTTRHGSSVSDGAQQHPDAMYFVELGQPAALWVVPVDLSAPPRRLAELPRGASSCHTPLASPDGTRFGFAEDLDRNTVRITTSPATSP